MEIPQKESLHADDFGRKGGLPVRIQSLTESIHSQWQVQPGWCCLWQQLFCDISSISNERWSADSAAKDARNPRGQCYR